MHSFFLKVTNNGSIYDSKVEINICVYFQVQLDKSIFCMYGVSMQWNF